MSTDSFNQFSAMLSGPFIGGDVAIAADPAPFKREDVAIAADPAPFNPYAKAFGFSTQEIVDIDNNGGIPIA